MSQTPADIPDLTGFDAVLFDLDGVLTPTADLHMRAWRDVFEQVFAEKDVLQPYTDDDYFVHLDGKHRYAGVESVLLSRRIHLPMGSPADPPQADTVCGVGNRKNGVFLGVLEREGIAPYPGSLALIQRLRAAGTPMAIVSSSKNARKVLTGAGIEGFFPVIVDGELSAREGLGSKPAPDMFLHAARLLQVDPARTAVFEDAISGVAAAAAGRFPLVVGVDRGVGPAPLVEAGAHIVVDDLAVFEKAAG